MQLRAPSPVHPARIEDGQFHWASQEARNGFWKRIKDLDGCEVEIIIRKKRKKRSLAQNAYYWCVVVKMIADEMGLEGESGLEETHEALKQEFMRKQLPVRPQRGDVVPLRYTIRSTTSLDTVEMTNYIEACRHLGSRMYGIYIPDPGEAVERGLVAL